MGGKFSLSFDLSLDFSFSSIYYIYFFPFAVFHFLRNYIIFIFFSNSVYYLIGPVFHCVIACHKTCLLVNVCIITALFSLHVQIFWRTLEKEKGFYNSYFVGVLVPDKLVYNMTGCEPNFKCN